MKPGASSGSSKRSSTGRTLAADRIGGGQERKRSAYVGERDLLLERLAQAVSESERKETKLREMEARVRELERREDALRRQMVGGKR